MNAQGQLPLISNDAKQTYFGLRLGLFLLILLLGIAVVTSHIVSDGQLCGSLSAYYYTNVRPVFVGVLCAIGAALIFYRGNIALENTALDFAGFSALVVAFVPTGRPAADSACPTANVPAVEDLDGLVQVAVPGLLIVGAVAVVAGLVFFPRPQGRSLWLTVAAFVAIVVAAVLFFGWSSFYRPTVDTQLLTAHNTAAVTLFVFMLITIGLNIWAAHQKNEIAYRNIYGALAAVMFVGCVLFLLLTGLRTHIFWAEAVGIGGFGAFWLVQTVKLLRQANRTAAEESVRVGR